MKSVTKIDPNEGPDDDNWLMEDFVVKQLMAHLKDSGYTVHQFSLGKQQGIDVHASKGHSVIVVEAKGAKGNPKNGPVNRDKFDSGQIRDHLGKAIVKAFELKNSFPTAECWIAHPDTSAIRKIVTPIQAHLKAAGITCVYVDQSGRVKGLQNSE